MGLEPQDFDSLRLSEEPRTDGMKEKETLGREVLGKEELLQSEIIEPEHENIQLGTSEAERCEDEGHEEETEKIELQEESGESCEGKVA